MIQMEESYSELRSAKVIAMTNTFERSLLKRSVLRKTSPIVGLFYCFFLKRGGVCQMRTMEHGSLSGSVSMAKMLIEDNESACVIPNVICTIDDVRSLRRPECNQVFECRHDDIEKLSNHFHEFGKGLSCQPAGDASLLFMAVDLADKSVKVLQHCNGDWMSATLQQDLQLCTNRVLEGQVKTVGFQLTSILSKTEHLDDWVIGNCLPNYNTKLLNLSSETVAVLIRQSGKCNVWSAFGMKRMFLSDFRHASLQSCLDSLNYEKCDHVASRSKSFKKRRSDHASAEGNIGE